MIKTIHGIDLFAEGGIEALLDHHRKTFGDAVMELQEEGAPIESNEEVETPIEEKPEAPEGGGLNEDEISQMLDLVESLKKENETLKKSANDHRERFRSLVLGTAPRSENTGEVKDTSASQNNDTSENKTEEYLKNIMSQKLKFF